MFKIDQYAYANRLGAVHPAEKFAFAVVTMIVCIVFSSMLTSLAVILLMSFITVRRAGIPGRFYLKLLSIPLSFLVVSVVTIAFTVSRETYQFIYGFTVWNLHLGITARDLDVAVNLFFKSLGAVSCLYFLSLTTSMVEIMSVLKRIRVPLLFIELMGLVYRFVFVLMETAGQIHTAQSARWGYASFRNSYRSLGQLISNLFIKSYHRSQMLFTALLARCYTDELNVIEPGYPVSAKNVLMIVLVELALVAMSLFTGGGLFGGIYS